ncbi:Ig-like domain-containing protein [Cohnella herbarum]|uniref:Cadherin-like domain-containing protein n=1 Tax=Cohnella herbarum TaxID=2728023 RepID=A0A7Z2ZPK0_9BACL|nr:Ig-like domain-containing protein [Cohnella herbarum]QJD86960.1 cadherin-like domain-containing protein [Cohnella herbarum]
MSSYNKKKSIVLSLVFTLLFGMFNFTGIGAGNALASTAGIYLNDTDPSIAYNGGWGYSSNRGAGDYQNDVHYTSANGDSVEYTFVGTGIEVVAPASNDAGYGKFDVLIDGVSQGIADAGGRSSNYLSQQILYSNKNLTMGQHTIRLVKTSGSYLQVDAFIKYENGTLTDQQIADLVKAKIDALPDKASVTLADKQAVQAAENSYNALTEAQKALVGDISRLTDAKIAIQQLEAIPVNGKITYLMADRADRSASLGQFVDPSHVNEKRFWVTNWNSPADYFKWTVNVPVAGEYVVDALIKAPTNSTITVTSVTYGNVQFAGSGDWDKIRAPGTLLLPAGLSEILVTASNPNHNELKSLELIPAAEWPAMEQRIADFRSDTQWFRDAKYGVFFQWGEWGYPQSGAKKPWPRQIDEFDVDAFADQMSVMGAGYVIWSVTWWSYYFPAPIQAVDDILPGHTSQRDLIGELADALNERGIKLMLYYHTGSETKPWWDETWVSMDDKTKFLTHWKQIMTEVGNRYGTKLAGWYIDDDCIYYPADYEELGAAAKAGNPDRLITYNNWQGPRGTDFQDYVSAEWYMPLPNNDNGIMIDGRYKGLQAHVAFNMENDWGIHLPNQPIVPSVSAGDAVSRIVTAMQDHQVLSYNMMMYEDGSMNPNSVQSMIYVKNAAKYGIIGTDDPSEQRGMYNDSDPFIAYTGNWDVSTGRSGDTYRTDVHYSMTNGDSAEFTFSGSEIQFITETASNQGEIEVYVDGVSQGTVNTYSPTRMTNQVVFAKQGLSPDGTHTIKLVKKNGAYMLVDAFKVVKVSASNRKPVANGTAVQTAINQDFIGQLLAMDEDGDALSYKVKENGLKGTAVIDYRTGKFSYTPNTGASGTDSFTYFVDDGYEASNLATVTVQIVEPVAVISSQPADQAANVPYGHASAKITFNQTLKQGANFNLITLKSGRHSLKAHLQLNGNTLSVYPKSGFKAATTYTLTLPASAIKGELGDGLASEYRLTFTTASKPRHGSGSGSHGNPRPRP